MNTIKVDFLNDYNKTLDSLKHLINPEDKLNVIKFYTSGKIDDNNKFERSFYNFEDINLDQEIYEQVEKITMILNNNGDLKTFHCDKNSGLIVYANSNEKKELKKMTSEVNIDNIDMNDDCTYYKFEDGIIGKYDPNTSSYYIYEDNEWKISGAIMRWIEDPAYDYEIINKENKIPKL